MRRIESARAGQRQSVESLLERAKECLAGGDLTGAGESYRDILAWEPRNAVALNGLGTVLCRWGGFKDAEKYLRLAVEAEPQFADALNNLGYALRALGRYSQAEVLIRRAAGLQPRDSRIQINLAYVLLMQGRTHEARECFEGILSGDPEQLQALTGLGRVAQMDGRFAEAEALFKDVLDRDPRNTAVWATVPTLRRMTPEDGEWIEKVEALAARGLPIPQEASLRYAMGKYWEDVGDYARAFRSYKRANELLKTTVPGYNRAARTAYVDDMVRIYTAEAIGQVRTATSPSERPVFVLGMPRSGTSLVEQIIASHPEVHGAGELDFWTEVLLQHITAIRQGVLSGALRTRLAEAYLGALHAHSAEARFVVDKAPVNAEYLGFIHSVFPNARVIYTRRNPVDTCLSCYFQYLSPALSYAMDLGDLAHYYREHHRLMQHWRTVLPAGTLLEVPYEELVTDQELWTRRILDFLELEWDPRCLNYHEARRPVVTASGWQVRQKIYNTSVERWRNYEAFIGPLLELRDLDS